MVLEKLATPPAWPMPGRQLASYQELLERIETGDRGMLIHCPHCKHVAKVRTSRAISNLTREAYFQCSNLACGHTFRTVTEVVQTISPSAVPDPVVEQQLLPASRKSGQ